MASRPAAFSAAIHWAISSTPAVPEALSSAPRWINPFFLLGGARVAAVFAAEVVDVRADEQRGGADVRRSACWFARSTPSTLRPVRFSCLRSMVAASVKFLDFESGDRLAFVEFVMQRLQVLAGAGQPGFGQRVGDRNGRQAGAGERGVERERHQLFADLGIRTADHDQSFGAALARGHRLEPQAARLDEASALVLRECLRAGSAAPSPTCPSHRDGNTTSRPARPGRRPKARCRSRRTRPASARILPTVENDSGRQSRVHDAAAVAPCGRQFAPARCRRPSSTPAVNSNA